jgi:hypothetical protein
MRILEEDGRGCAPLGVLIGGVLILVVGIPDWGMGHRVGGSVAAVIFGSAFVVVGIYRLIRDAFRR